MKTMPTHFRGTPQEVLALDTFIKLTRATNSLMSRLAAHEALGDLTQSQFGVLETLFHLGPLSQTEICGKLLKSGGNITLVIDNLEKRSWVRRDADPEDRRTTIVSLTPAGEALIREVFPLHLQAIVAEMGALLPEEQKLLAQLCKKLGKRESESVLKNKVG
jgi:MarR family transcriptional regulator, 2-MHQ and catechol-resistance regulon repressor